MSLPRFGSRHDQIGPREDQNGCNKGYCDDLFHGREYALAGPRVSTTKTPQLWRLSAFASSMVAGRLTRRIEKARLQLNASLWAERSPRPTLGRGGGGAACPTAAASHRLRSPNLSKEQADVAIGTVKWFNPTKGYGFIQPDTGGKDVFVHISAVERAGLDTLAEGAKVSYEERENRGKTSAENLRVG